MKKLLVLLTLFLFTITLTACTKDEIENELNAEREMEELVTDEEMKELQKDPEFMEDYMEELIDATEEAKINEDYNLVRELEDSEEDKKSGKAKGSCYAIESSSTCMEYYGSFWSEQQIKLQCQGAGTFSKDPCPEDMAGGCNTGVGTMADMVAWMYTRGGGEIDAESMKYAKMACDATMASKWIQMK